MLVTSKANEVGAAYRLLALEGHLIDNLNISRSSYEKQGYGDLGNISDWTARPVGENPREPAVPPMPPDTPAPAMETESGPME